MERAKRKLRTKSKLFGTSVRPRVVVFRSNKYIYLQAIDDSRGVTIGASSKQKSKAPAVDLAKILKAKKIKKIVFDRAGYQYHGEVKKIAEELRAAGLEF